METQIITPKQIENHGRWTAQISRLSGNFGVDAQKVEEALIQEIKTEGMETLLGHLRLCGAIPEQYAHDSSEEKLYSKYTDAVICQAYRAMGFTALLIQEQSNQADVECVAADYSFVADAKAFRLSRTAKNQKDFKVQAMDNWKHGKPYAMIVCPIYQLPSRVSQIYQQAAARAVCIAAYTHLAVLVRYAQQAAPAKAIQLVYEIFRAVAAMNPSRDAGSYWQGVNRTILTFDPSLAQLWREEKLASIEAIPIARKEALAFLASERERVMRLSREEAIAEMLKGMRLDSKTRAVQSVGDNGLLEFN